MINGILRVKRKFKNSLVYEISYSHGILRSGRRESDKKSSYTHGILRVEIWVNSSGHQLQSRNFVPREKFELLFVGAKKENKQRASGSELCSLDSCGHEPAVAGIQHRRTPFHLHLCCLVFLCSIFTMYISQQSDIDT